MSVEPPFDDTVQLEAMAEREYYDDADTAPIVNSGGGDSEVVVQTATQKVDVSGVTMDENGAPLRGRKKAFITVATLLLINLLNYMDRFTVAGK